MTGFEFVILLILLMLCVIMCFVVLCANTLVQIRETLISIRNRTPIPPLPPRN